MCCIDKSQLPIFDLQSIGRGIGWDELIDVSWIIHGSGRISIAVWPCRELGALLACKRREPGMGLTYTVIWGGLVTSRPYTATSLMALEASGRLLYMALRWQTFETPFKVDHTHSPIQTLQNSEILLSSSGGWILKQGCVGMFVIFLQRGTQAGEWSIVSQFTDLVIHRMMSECFLPVIVV